MNSSNNDDDDDDDDDDHFISGVFTRWLFTY